MNTSVQMQAGRILLLALCSAAAAPALGGVARVAAGLPLTESLGIGAAAALFLFVVLREPSGSSKLPLSLGLLVGLFFLILFVIDMYHPAFDGLPSVGGGDAADHVYYKDQFMRETFVYNGFVIFSSYAAWVEKLSGLTPFESFRLLFYGAGAAVILLFTALGITVSRSTGQRKKAAVVFGVLLILLGYLPFERIVFPILHYLQADGFYPQLFGLLPLLLCWLLYAGSQSAWRRALILMLLFVLYRFTYGLNLADFSLAAALLLVVEAEGKNISHRFSAAAMILGIVMGGLSLYLYDYLLILGDKDGAIIEPVMPLVLTGNLILCISLSAAASFFSEAATCQSIVRACRFSAYFGMCSLAAAAVYLLCGGKVAYYLHKYHAHPTVLAALSAVVVGSVLAVSLAELLRRGELRKAAASSALLCSLFLGLFVVQKAYFPYRPSYAERVNRTVPYRYLKPLNDTFAERYITSVLSKEGRRFGGFISTPQWALSRFVNASFGNHQYNLQPLYRSGKVKRRAPYCVFWNSDRDTMERLARVSKGKAVQVLNKLTALPPDGRVRYRTAWSSLEKEISHRCF